MKKLHTTKQDAVSDMVNGLNEYAEKLGVSLKNRIPDDINDLDDVFKDGGEGRCEHFTDLADTYASQFGQIEDYNNENGFEEHVWSCIRAAIKKLQKQHGKAEDSGNGNL